MENNITTRIGDININCDITKDDIIAIAVSKHEQELFATKEILEREISRLEDLAEKIKKDRQKHIVAIAELRFAKHLNAVAGNMKALGFSECRADMDVTIRAIRQGLDDQAIFITLSLGQTNTNGYHHKMITRTESIDFDKQTGDLSTELAKVAEKLEETRVEAVKNRKELSKISTMERHARATLAMNVLNSSEEGKQFLAGLDIQKALTGK